MIICCSDNQTAMHEHESYPSHQYPEHAYYPETYDYQHASYAEPYNQATANTQQQPTQENPVEYGPQIGPSTEASSLASETEQTPQILMPPNDVAPVIDKMAHYVVKNGPDFEYVVKNKADNRFAFVHSWHKYNAFYEHRKEFYKQVIRPVITTFFSL